MRTATVLLTVLCCATAYAAPKGARLAKASTTTASRPVKAPEAFYVVTCASQSLSTPKSVRLMWSDGWSSPDAKKLQRDLGRTCVADLRTAGCKQPRCSCTAKLAAKPASQPASRPATTQPVKLTQAKQAKTSGSGDLPRPGETKVEVTP
jgi:hypothetical protein